MPDQMNFVLTINADGEFVSMRRFKDGPGLRSFIYFNFIFWHEYGFFFSPLINQSWFSRRDSLGSQPSCINLN